MPPINYVAIFAAAVAAWLAGAVWYGVLGKQWLAALGWTEADIAGPDGKRQMPVGPMVLSFVASLVMAFLLSGLMAHVGPITVRSGVISAALVWVGFVITTIAVNNAFQKRKAMLTVIDGGHWLLALIVQGAVLGAMG
jgi:Protein of unknown function (DUF1761)